MKSSSIPAFLFFVTISMLQALGAPVAAQDSPPARSVILIGNSADLAQTRELERALSSQFSDLAVFLQVEAHPPFDLFEDQVALAAKVAAENAAVAVVWIREGSDGTVYLYVADPGQRRILVRTLDVQGVDNLRETVALIVRSAVGLMLDGGQIGVSAPAMVVAPVLEPPLVVPPSPVPSPAPDKRDVIPGRLGLGFAYSFQVRSADHLLHGFAVEGFGTPVEWLELAVGYTVWSLVRVETSQVHTEIARHPVHVRGGVAGAVGRVVLGGGVALIADFTSQRTIRLMAQGAYSRDNRDTIISVAPRGSVGFVVNRYLSLVADVGVEIPLNPVRYVFRTDSGDSVVEDPSGAQFFVHVGLRVSVY